MSYQLKICFGPTCSTNFSEDLLAITENSSRADLKIDCCGCLGHCEDGPNVMLNGTVRVGMTPNQLLSQMEDLPVHMEPSK